MPTRKKVMQKGDIVRDTKKPCVQQVVASQTTVLTKPAQDENS